MVVPEKLYDKFLYAKFSSDIASFGLMQRCMREFFKRGWYRRHLERLRVEVKRRKKLLMKVIHRHSCLSVSPHQAGYSLWVKSNRAMELPQVPWTRGDAFSFAPEVRSYFRISFMHMESSDFDQGLVYLHHLFG